MIKPKKTERDTRSGDPPLNRSQMMARVGGRNTRPELMVRSALHRAGYRFRLWRRDLPGRPDIVLPRFQTAIFVHGCFWHQHEDCRRATTPKTNVAFWKDKLARNKARDLAATKQLRAAGWKTLVIWECELREAGWEARLIETLAASED